MATNRPPTPDPQEPAEAPAPMATSARAPRGTRLVGALGQRFGEQAPADPRALLAAAVIVFGGWLLCWLLYLGVNPADYIPTGNYTTFAGLFVTALAIERLLEPFSGLVMPTTDQRKAERDAARASFALGNSATTASDVQQAKKRYAYVRTSRAVILWAVATLLGMILAAVFGLFLVRTTTTTGKIPAVQPGIRVTAPNHKTAPKDPNRFVDLLVTGLVVGAGTKPLHDLISRVQASNENSKANAASAA
jgi:MFS family permease